MSQAKSLESFYSYVQANGSLLSNDHAVRWTRATLQTLGLNMSGRAKRQFASALPRELSDNLNDVWWLFNFRNTNQSAIDFQQRVARRAGNTDKEFARLPIQAVFGGIRQMVDSNVSDRVANDLSPELRAMWETSLP